jgi:protein transport protein SEC23
MRVATKATYWADANTRPEALGFSSTAAGIVLARWLAYEASRGANARELSTWLDRQLVSLTQRAASFKEGDADSVVLPGELAALPELVFHMRRSTFLNYFGDAPDVTVFYRSLLFRCAPLPVLQPTIVCYNTLLNKAGSFFSRNFEKNALFKSVQGVSSVFKGSCVFFVLSTISCTLPV